MEKEEPTPPASRKGQGGRKPKPEAEKALHKVGSFWLTEAEKRYYDRLFSASGLTNQTEFFRQVIFKGKLKLYYSDRHSQLIYEN